MYGNCIHCGNLESLTREKICKSCQAIDAHLLQKAREIIRLEGKKSVYEMADLLVVKPTRIFYWISQGKLRNNLFKYVCPLCGEDLSTTLCACKSKSVSSTSLRRNEKFHTSSRVEDKRRSYWDSKSSIRKNQKRDIWFLT